MDIESSEKKSSLTDMVLMHNSENIVTEDTTTFTEDKNVADPNSNDNSSNFGTNQNK
ncbi:7876_t:CDS:1, partial [Gigaspora rosea]